VLFLSPDAPNAQVASPARLKPDEPTVPAQSPSVLPETMVFFSVVVPAAPKIPPPLPPVVAPFTATVTFVSVVPALLCRPPPWSAMLALNVEFVRLVVVAPASTRMPPPLPLAVLSLIVVFVTMSEVPACSTPAPASPEFTSIVTLSSVIVPRL
jgi:hypothetical protein